MTKNRNDINVETAASLWMDRAQGAHPFMRTIAYLNEEGNLIVTVEPDSFERQPCCPPGELDREHSASLDHLATMAGTNPINLARKIQELYQWCAYCKSKQDHATCPHHSILARPVTTRI